MNSLEELEEELKNLNALCDATTGQETYHINDEKRKAIIVEIQKHRSITRWEYICCYGYTAWIDYTEKHDLPEDHPVHMYKVFMNIGRGGFGYGSCVNVESYSPNDLAKVAEEFWKSVPNGPSWGTQVLIWDQEAPIPDNLLAVWCPSDQSQPLRMMQ